MRRFLARRGFTLIEVLVVVSIIGILSGLSFFGIKDARESSRDSIRKSNLQLIASALDLYKQDCNTYPTALPTSGGKLIGTGVGRCKTSNTYIASMPADPQGTNKYYNYSSSGKKYELCAALEKGTGSVTCGSSNVCGSQVGERQPLLSHDVVLAADGVAPPVSGHVYAQGYIQDPNGGLTQNGIGGVTIELHWCFSNCSTTDYGANWEKIGSAVSAVDGSWRIDPGSHWYKSQTSPASYRLSQLPLPNSGTTNAVPASACPADWTTSDKIDWVSLPASGCDGNTFYRFSPTVVTPTPTSTPKANGQSCSGPVECQSGFCTSGVCCNTACVGVGMSCNQAGAVGICTLLPTPTPTIVPLWTPTPTPIPYTCNYKVTSP